MRKKIPKLMWKGMAQKIKWLLFALDFW